MKFLKGRTNRAMYWLCVGIVVAFAVVMAFARPGGPGVSEFVLIIVCIPRLHDIGRSGWWVLAGLAVEVAGVFGGLFLFPAQALLVMGAMNVVLFGFLVWLGALPGQPFDNRFGPPPPPGLSSGKPEAKPDPQVFD